jgi:hypothetical protein
VLILMIQSNGALNPMGTMVPNSGNVNGIAFRAGHP